MSSKLEDLLGELGQPGRQQLISMSFLVLATVLSISFNHLLSLITLIPPHHCTITNQSLSFQNDSIPILESDGKFDSCQMYVDPTNHSLGLKQCDQGYTFHFQDGDRQTVATEWELVCDRRYLVRIYQTVCLAGVTVGGLLFGYLADTYGRYSMTLISVTSQLVLGIAIAFIPNFEVSCILGFLRGACLQGMTVSGFTLSSEMFDNKYRTKITTIALSAPALGMAIVAMYNYPIANWRYQILAHACSAIICLIALIFYTRESVRWLLSQNQIDKTRDVVNFTVKLNGIPPPDNLDTKLKEIVAEIQSKSKTIKKETFIDVMRHPFLRNACLIQFFAVLAAQMTIYGFSFLIGEIGGNVHVNFTVISVVELAFRGVAYFMMEKWGRKNTTILIFGIMSASNFIYTISHYYQKFYPPLEVFSMVVAIIGRIFNGLYFVSAMTICTELSPTTVRSSIFGAVNTTGRLGLVFLPFLLLLGDYVWKQLPFVIFGTCALISALLFALLPETRGIVIPNTIEEAIQFKFHKITTKDKKSIKSNIPDLTVPMLSSSTT